MTVLSSSSSIVKCPYDSKVVNIVEIIEKTVMPHKLLADFCYRTKRYSKSVIARQAQPSIAVGGANRQFPDTAVIDDGDRDRVARLALGPDLAIKVGHG